MKAFANTSFRTDPLENKWSLQLQFLWTSTSFLLNSQFTYIPKQIMNFVSNFFLHYVHYTIIKQINPPYPFLFGVCWSLPLVFINTSIILLWSLDKGKVECNSQIYSSFATAWDHSWSGSSNLKFLNKELIYSWNLRERSQASYEIRRKKYYCLPQDQDFISKV